VERVGCTCLAVNQLRGFLHAIAFFLVACTSFSPGRETSWGMPYSGREVFGGVG